MDIRINDFVDVKTLDNLVLLMLKVVKLPNSYTNWVWILQSSQSDAFYYIKDCVWIKKNM